jgi:ABC-2 type transport system ATP-binding protein
MTVLLSSHQLPEVQELCDRVAIVDSGRVVYEGALSDLRRQGGTSYRLRTADDGRALALLRSQRGVDGAIAAAHGLEFSAQEQAVGELSLALGRAGIAILALTPQLATLEDLFFRLTESADGESRTNGAREAVPAGAADPDPHGHAHRDGS